MCRPGRGITIMSVVTLFSTALTAACFVFIGKTGTVKKKLHLVNLKLNLSLVAALNF